MEKIEFYRILSNRFFQILAMYVSLVVCFEKIINL